MAAQPRIPADDLYRRLELPPNASFEAIEIAWRALLKRHHPDVAGADALDLAKRINVAHDWLSDPDLRARYDRERHPHRARRWSAAGYGRPRAAVVRATPVRPRPVDRAESVARFVARVARLSRDELDRLSIAQAPPIAFAATIERFLPPERRAAVEDVEQRIRAVMLADRWRDLATRDAVLAAAHELLLADFLDEHLTEPFRGRTRERLTRAWEAAVDQPRYGPNGAAVGRFLQRAERLTGAEIAALARAPLGRRHAGEPWPRTLDPHEDEALRVSAALALRDAVAVVGQAVAGLDRVGASRVRRHVGRAAHAVALRHAFTAAEYAELVGPWTAATGDPATGRGADQPPGASVRRA
jgi:curved DNA-binding protein CbpA